MQSIATQRTTPRQPRGNYAKLLCLNCRARKIKCVLPDHVTIEPSPQPQTHESSCARCIAQGLECIVDHAILGRPSAKRTRTELGIEHDEPRQMQDEVEPTGDDVVEFVLLDVRTEVEAIEQRSRKDQIMSKPSKHEIFSALLDPAHLFASLVARDKDFGQAAFGQGDQMGEAVDPLAIVDARLAKELDMRLVWQRHHLPQTAYLSKLHTEFVQTPRDAPSKTVSLVLFAILCLSALDVPARLVYHEPDKMKVKLGRFVSQELPSLLFDLPAHPHMLDILEIAHSYKPLLFVTQRKTAPSALGGRLHFTLAMQVAKRLNLGDSISALSLAMATNTNEDDTSSLEQLVLDSLRWCKWLMFDVAADGFLKKTAAEQNVVLAEVSSAMDVVTAALEIYHMPPSYVTLYCHLRWAVLQTKASVASQAGWHSLDALGSVILDHERDMQDLQDHTFKLLDRLHSSYSTVEIQAARQLISAELNRSNVNVAGLCLFYALMSNLHAAQLPTEREDALTVDDALKVSSEILHHVKGDRIHNPTAVFLFLQRHGDPRVIRTERVIQDFVCCADNLIVNGVPWQPPPLPFLIPGLLQAGRELVENNATRMKGWQGLHPNVDVQILLLQDCAKNLESFDPEDQRKDALACGSIYAAGAKQVRGLCAILMGWRKTVAEKAMMEQRDAGLGTEAASGQKEQDFAGVEEFLQTEDEGFGHWGDWPQAGDLDFAELFADGSEWTKWASTMFATT
ncbi:hypothetical protein B0A48_08479 [Cryoendolithus antarcticus]|uniref:Zn(2)-C6 fungal-type domain-containing protein n=1 Tax=Cryoendolithus antarcticus TaxID=1507870 RepID=A0A1V8T691_9PEZI|nr:hypothetical protein B0A48_08479 [Cryoendolithus antarcticus]